VDANAEADTAIDLMAEMSSRVATDIAYTDIVAMPVRRQDDCIGARMSTASRLFDPG